MVSIAIRPSRRGTGWGVFALRDIANTTPFHSEPPFVRFSRDELGGEREGELLRVALEDLETRRTFDGLEGSSDSAKLNTNCSPLNPSAGLVGLFKSHSKLNHSCRPNAVAMVDRDVMTMVAQKDVKEGDEITICYLSPSTNILLSKAERCLDLARSRRGAGLDAWDCQCELCTASERVRAESDTRRAEMRVVRARILRGKDPLMDFLAMQKLASAEGVPMPLALGNEGTLMVAQLLGGSRLGPEADQKPLDSDFNATHFPIGARVTLFALAKRPELNGRTGRVVKAMNKHTRRLGVRLDAEGPDGGDGGESPPIALRLHNVMLCVSGAPQM